MAVHGGPLAEFVEQVLDPVRAIRGIGKENPLGEAFAVARIATLPRFGKRLFERPRAGQL